MKFVSTRGKAPKLNFGEVLLKSLASDGGLYVPETWPQLTTDELDNLNSLTTAQTAKFVFEKFITEDDILANVDLNNLTESAFSTFRHAAVTPLVQVEENHFILELFHGPTLAFKDVAMQLLVRLIDEALKVKNDRITIVGATSGDTGGAAVEAFANANNIELFIFYPKNRVSDVQRKIMTTQKASHCHAIEIDGTFDDCQNIVKALFADEEFSNKVKLSAVNSINWARIAAQVVYYLTSYSRLGGTNNQKQPIFYSVPTGNFGDIFAGYVAKRMGIDLNGLIIATNQNDILTRVMKTGEYNLEKVQESSSPSMDIQISSNFERYLFDALDRDDKKIADLMKELRENGSFKLNDDDLVKLHKPFNDEFVLDAFRADERDVKAVIRSFHSKTGYVMDTHTACGVYATHQFQAKHHKLEDLKLENARFVTLSTAHPAKFPQAMTDILGEDAKGAIKLPSHYESLMKEKENFEPLPNDIEAVKNHILNKI